MEKIIEVLRAKFADKLKRRVNTAIVLYNFDWKGHFSNHLLSQMREKKTEEYHIFHVENVLTDYYCLSFMHLTGRASEPAPLEA